MSIIKHHFMKTVHWFASRSIPLPPRKETQDHQTGSLVGPRAGQDAVKTTNCVPTVNRTPKSSHCTDQPAGLT